MVTATPIYDTAVIAHLELPTLCQMILVVGPPDGTEGGRPDPCQKVAQWDCICLHCGRIAPVCEDHRRAVLSLRRIACSLCRKVAAPRKMFAFDLLKGGAR